MLVSIARTLALDTSRYRVLLVVRERYGCDDNLLRDEWL